jgi:hypothetical protein
MNTFESSRNVLRVESGGGNPGFFQGNVKLSQGLDNDRFRMDFAAGGGRNGDENIV